MLIDLRLCTARDKKTGKYWFMREDEHEYTPLAGPFETEAAAQDAMDQYNKQHNGWDH